MELVQDSHASMACLLHAVPCPVATAAAVTAGLAAIYDQQVWGSGEYNGGGSGYGSSLNFTARVRAMLPDLINR
jgi:hypothetical protein